MTACTWTMNPVTGLSECACGRKAVAVVTNAADIATARAIIFGTDGK